MEFSRRNFLSYSGALAIAGGTVMNTGCWNPFSPDVLAQITKYVAVGLQAFSAVVGIATSAGVINPVEGDVIFGVINLVKAGFADLQTAVSNYNAAPADQKQTLLGKVATAVAVLEGSIQEFWNDLHIPNPTLSAVIEGLLGVILSTLAGWGSLLPSVVGYQKKALPKAIVVTPKKRSPKEFKKDFNAIIVQGAYGQYLVN